MVLRSLFTAILLALVVAPLSLTWASAEPKACSHILTIGADPLSYEEELVSSQPLKKFRLPFDPEITETDFFLSDISEGASSTYQAKYDKLLTDASKLWDLENRFVALSDDRTGAAAVYFSSLPIERNKKRVGTVRVVDATRYFPEHGVNNPKIWGGIPIIQVISYKGRDIYPPAVYTLSGTRKRELGYGRPVDLSSNPHPGLSKLVEESIYPKKIFEIGRWIVSAEQPLIERLQVRRVLESWLLEKYVQPNPDAHFIAHVANAELVGHFVTRYGFDATPLDVVTVPQEFGGTHWILKTTGSNLSMFLKKRIEESGQQILMRTKNF